MGWEKGDGFGVLVEQKMGTWHHPVTKLQTAASALTPNVLLPAPLCASEQGVLPGDQVLTLLLPCREG